MTNFKITVTNTDCPDYRKGGKCTHPKRFKYSRADKMAYLTGNIHFVQQACDEAKCPLVEKKWQGVEVTSIHFDEEPPPEIGAEVKDAEWVDLRPTIYIAGPYTAYLDFSDILAAEARMFSEAAKGNHRSYDYAAIDANIKRARDKEVELMKMGFAVFCPHMNTARMERDTDIPYETFLEIDMTFLEKCDVVYFLKGWEKSNGAMQELARAVNWGKNVVHEGEVGELGMLEKLLSK